MWRVVPGGLVSCVSSFTTNSRRWSTPFSTNYDIDLFSTDSVHIDGSLYWINSHIPHDGVWHRDVVCFKLHDRLFETIDLPMEANGFFRDLVVVDSSLVAVSVIEVDEGSTLFYAWKREGRSNRWYDWKVKFMGGPVHDNRNYIGVYNDKFVFSSSTAMFRESDYMCRRRIYYIADGHDQQLKTICGQSSMMFAILKLIGYRKSLNLF